MPYINVRVLEGIDKEQKDEVIRRITDVMVEVLGKNPDTTIVVIDELSPDNWGIGGQSITERKKRST
jgi:4-oxalocrotonate tautomerase